MESILQTINDLGPECSGAQIRDHLENRGRRVSVGRLYVNLWRLEDLGYITGAERPGGPERNNLPKRVYWLTANGSARLQIAKAERERRRRIKLRILERVIFVTGDTFLSRFPWYRRWRGGKWALATGLFWGKNWIRVHPADECFERVEEDYTKKEKSCHK